MGSRLPWRTCWTDDLGQPQLMSARDTHLVCLLTNNHTHKKGSGWSWIWPLYPYTKLNLRQRVLGEVEKTLMLGKIEGGRRRGGWAGWRASATQWMSLSKQLVMDREAWRAALHAATKSRTRLSDWTELKKRIALLLCQAKGGHSGLMSSKLCVPVWRG